MKNFSVSLKSKKTCIIDAKISLIVEISKEENEFNKKIIHFQEVSLISDSGIWTTVS